ncbi:MAG: response regulator transcription factor [Pseudomonadota bacterium]
MSKILLADDHEIFLQGLKGLLLEEPDFNVVDTCPDGAQAWQSIQEYQPNIAVLDFRMPGLNGIQVTRLIKQNNLPTKIILLTMHDDAFLISEAAQAGVSGYLVKETAFENLVKTIKDVISGKDYSLDEIMQQQDLSPEKARVAQLSKQERFVLQQIAQGHTNKEIARELQISPKTVETYRSRVMEKIDLHSIAELTRYAIRVGLVD